MLPALQQYLQDRSFVEVVASGVQQPGLKVQTYENKEFRLHVFNEREREIYVQISSLAKPEERRYLPGLVAFLTGDDSATRSNKSPAQWLEQHHAALAAFFATSNEARAQRERYAAWEQEFGKREHARLVALAAEQRAQAKPWWKFW